MAHSIGPHPRSWRHWLGGLGLLLTLGGCASPAQPALEILTIGKAIGLRRPYTNSLFLDAEPHVLSRRLVDHLERNGAQLLVSDGQTGLLSWCDPGLAFAPLPTSLPPQFRTAPTDLAPPLGTWHGLVYGTARLRATPQGTWVYVHTLGQESGSTRVVFSDGSYERGLFSALAHDRAPLHPAARGPRGPSDQPARADMGASTALRACFPAMRNVAHVRAQTVRDTGLAKVYPAPLEALWGTSLDVLAQSTALAHIAVSERLILFFQGIALPQALAPDTLQPVNVLLALHAEPRGSDGSTVYVAWLAPPALTVTVVRDLSKKKEPKVLEELKHTPMELAAALVVDRLFEHLATQLFYPDRWEDKFRRRFTGPDKGP